MDYAILLLILLSSMEKSLKKKKKKRYMKLVSNRSKSLVSAIRLLLSITVIHHTPPHYQNFRGERGDIGFLSNGAYDPLLSLFLLLFSELDDLVCLFTNLSGNRHLKAGWVRIL